MDIQKHTDFNTFLQKQLNESQYKAVTHGKGPLLVIAGAGSGKTRVITARITNLIINNNINPHSIIALTFTNKAANEMKERIHHFIGNTNSLPFIGTFHSYCLLLLKKYSSFDFFSILDSDDQEKMIKNILQRSNVQKQFTAKNVMYQISQFKNNPLGDPELFFSQRVIYECYITYEKEKRASKYFDFDDLLVETLKLFNHNTVFKDKFQNNVRHVLVDEYQDTNTIQHALLKHMTKKDDLLNVDSVCVVGDEDQSIYSWRGATITNMLNFTHDYINTTFIKIEQNYRSVEPILELANKVIEHNTQRNPKILWSEKKGSHAICLLTCVSEYQESDAIAYAIKSTAHKKSLDSFAVFYRTHTQSRAIEESFIKNGIAYKIVGGIQFYERREIKDLLAYLKLIVNPFDRISLLRILNVPARGLGTKCEELIEQIWKDQPFLTYKEAIESICQQNIIPLNKQLLLRSFVTLFDDLTPQDKPHIALEKIIKRIDYISFLKNTYEEQEARERIENVQELSSAVYHFESEALITTQLFLEEVALMQEKLRKTNKTSQMVMVMTLHAAKGLEFDTVFLTGLEENIIPTTRSLQQNSALEEERRLFYVGITRACNKLILSHAKHRYVYGQMQKQLPSRFVDEIPQGLIPHIDCSYWDKYKFINYFQEWFEGRISSDNTVMTFGNNIPHRNSQTKSFTKSFSSTTQKAQWRKNQLVKHAAYGAGIIKEIEKQNDATFYITVQFKNTTKKIRSDFLS